MAEAKVKLNTDLQCVFDANFTEGNVYLKKDGFNIYSELGDGIRFTNSKIKIKNRLFNFGNANLSLIGGNKLCINKRGVFDSTWDIFYRDKNIGTYSENFKSFPQTVTYKVQPSSQNHELGNIYFFILFFMYSKSINSA